MASANVHEVNDLNFDNEVIGSQVPVFVDFTAPWCGPCKMILPFIEQLADQYAGKVKVVKVDVDQSPNTAAKWKVVNVPTILMFKNGEVVSKQAGAADKRRLEKLIQEAL